MIHPQLYRILTAGLTSDLPHYADLVHQYGTPILDLGAGLGRIGEVFINDGDPVVFLEKDAAFCEELHHLHSHLPNSAQNNCWVVQADLTERDWLRLSNCLVGNKESLPQLFGTIIIGLRTLHLFPPNEQLHLLKNARHLLHPEGALIIHRAHLDESKADGLWRLVAEHPTENGILEIEECAIKNLHKGTFDLRHRIWQSEPNGQHVTSWRVAHDLHPISELDLQHSLAEVGFTAVDTQTIFGEEQLFIAKR